MRSESWAGGSQMPQKPEVPQGGLWVTCWICPKQLSIYSVLLMDSASRALSLCEPVMLTLVPRNE